MASYPTFEQLTGSVKIPVDDLQTDRASDGTGYSRSFFAAEKFRFNVRHILTLSQLSTLMTFYASNKLALFDFHWQGSGGEDFTNLLWEAKPKVTDLSNKLVQVDCQFSTR